MLHATQELVSLGLAKPILVGRPSVIEMRIQKLGLQIKAGVDFEIVNNESDPRFKEYWSEYYQLMKRRGITQEQAQRAVISNTTVIGAIMVHRGEADAMICGTIGEYHDHYRVVQPLFGYRDGVSTAGAMNALLLPRRQHLYRRYLCQSRSVAGRAGGDHPDGGGKRASLRY